MTRSSPFSAPSSFFFNDSATTEIYTLSLHDALPIFRVVAGEDRGRRRACVGPELRQQPPRAARVLGDDQVRDRKSTRLNSSHVAISYAVFCLKKKKEEKKKLSDDSNVDRSRCDGTSR